MPILKKNFFNKNLCAGIRVVYQSYGNNYSTKEQLKHFFVINSRMLLLL